MGIWGQEPKVGSRGWELKWGSRGRKRKWGLGVGNLSGDLEAGT